jgi:hypothetical protein
VYRYYYNEDILEMEEDNYTETPPTGGTANVRMVTAEAKKIPAGALQTHPSHALCAQVIRMAPDFEYTEAGGARTEHHYQRQTKN